MMNSKPNITKGTNDSKMHKKPPSEVIERECYISENLFLGDSMIMIENLILVKEFSKASGDHISSYFGYTWNGDICADWKLDIDKVEQAITSKDFTDSVKLNTPSVIKTIHPLTCKRLYCKEGKHVKLPSCILGP